MALPSPADPSPADLTLADPTLITASTLLGGGRELPVGEALTPTLGALPRGRVITCGGDAALSIAAALMARSTRTGSWVAVVGLADLGAECLAGFDVDLKRLIRVAVASPADWAECIAAAADGFDIILTSSVMIGVTPGVDRSVRQRIRGRGAVVFDIVPPSKGPTPRGRLSGDLALDAHPQRWVGTRCGAGHLGARQVEVTLHGRRQARPTSTTYWLPAPDGSVIPAS